ncbi:hypothetical protein CsSME_00005305 [Camellia sinensis var. sinensis]
MMRSIRMSWYLINIIVLSFTFSSLSEAQHEKKLPSAVVVGTVYCDTCFQEHFSKTSHFISGSFLQFLPFFSYIKSLLLVFGFLFFISPFVSAKNIFLVVGDGGRVVAVVVVAFAAAAVG